MSSQDVISSYFNAYKAQKTAMQEQRKSKIGPSNPQPKFRFTPPEQLTVSVLHRPKSPALSYAHVENIDVQHAKDQANFRRKQAQLRAQAGETWHNDGPSILGIWEQGHIVDKGRAKTETQANYGVFNPITSHFVIPPTPKVDPRRPQSAPLARSASFTSTPCTSRPDKVMQQTMGTIDPITGHVKQPADATYAARKKIEFERLYGGRGVYARVNPTQINPITGEPAFRPPVAEPKPRPASAPRPAAGKVDTTPPGGRPYTPGRHVMQGETWGTYNPINHVWQVQPRDSRYSQPSAMLDKAVGITGSHSGRGGPLRNQGIYNPINNFWVVPPSNPRIVNGLTFAPATLFCRTTPATIRTK